MTYQHRGPNGRALELPLGKVVCVGRNYADHAKELNNPVPTEPILFIKPNTALVPMAPEFSIPRHRGSCHVETEMALLIGDRISHANASQVVQSIAGVGVGFDLTLRDLQNTLKDKGLPWEKAKAFDGSCPLSEFVDPTEFDWGNVSLELHRNGELQQRGNSANMMTPVADLLAHISQYFTLLPGDVVMTGTPAGVGPLNVGDELQAELNGQLRLTSKVI